eukprot:2701434-Amphidinium_carterae.1
MCTPSLGMISDSGVEGCAWIYLYFSRVPGVINQMRKLLAAAIAELQEVGPAPWKSILLAEDDERVEKHIAAVSGKASEFN